MHDTFIETIKFLHTRNRIFWGVVLIDIIILAIITFIFDTFNFPGEPLIENLKIVNDVALMIIVIALAAIIILKRNFLVPDKLISKAEKKNLTIYYKELIPFKNEFGDSVELMNRVLMMLRKYYFLIWSLINMVVLIGFLVFLITGQMRPFLIYGVVALYALVINFPFFSIVERCYHRIIDND